MKIKTIIFGATGMVGEGVLLNSLDNPDVESVLAITRKPCGVKHNKLKEIVHNDFFNYSAIEKEITGYNACFFCLGVSSVGMKEKEYTHVTYDLTIQAASTLARLNPEMTFCYISGEGTDSSEKGRLMWARVKGKTENDLMGLPFKGVYNFRPGFIKPVKGQKHAYGVSNGLAHIYPFLKSLLPKHMCTLDDISFAMINVVKSGYDKKILENMDIDRVAKRN